MFGRSLRLQGPSMSYSANWLFRQQSVPVKQVVAIQPSSSSATNEPISFLKSKARKYPLARSYKVSPKRARVQRFGIPLGLSLFAFLMYFSFFRQDKKEDMSLITFITQDVRENFPEAKRFPQIPEEYRNQHKTNE